MTFPAPPPADVESLRDWFRTALRSAHPVRLAAVLRRIETLAGTRFPPHQVQPALQEAIQAELGCGAPGSPAGYPTPGGPERFRASGNSDGGPAACPGASAGDVVVGHATPA